MLTKNLKKIILIILILIQLFSLISCTKKDAGLLDPNSPITITVWNYYNGSIKELFDDFVNEFNETIGMDLGIIVESQSHGDVDQLQRALISSASMEIGSSPMPDVFASYSDNALSLSKLDALVALEGYFTEEELNEYKMEFLQEGQFLDDGSSYILPIAKSTENLFVNATDWKIFSNDFGFTNEDLLTWEGIRNISEDYFNSTGKSFFTMDSFANFFIIFSKQYGEELFHIDNNQNASLNFPRDLAEDIWNNFYIPHIKGYYNRIGRYATDDAKTGSVIAFVGSTAGAGYMPMEITKSENEIYPIESIVLPYPSIDGKSLFAVQQGAGMCIAKSDEVREYASSIFLKWFTEIDRNIEFALKSGYLPVKNKIYSDDILFNLLESEDFHNPTIKQSILTTIEMFNNYTLYSSKPFYGSSDIRYLLNTHLYNKILQDRQTLDKKVSSGEDQAALIEKMILPEEFEIWFNDIKVEIEEILK